MIPIERGASITYTGRQGEEYQGQQLTLHLDPCKQAGQGFGSATGQYMDVCIKYDAATQSGYGIRFVRVPHYDHAVEVSLIAYHRGTATALTEPQKCELFKRGCQLTLTYTQSQLTAEIANPQLNDHQPMLLTTPLAAQNASGGIYMVHTGSLGPSGVVISAIHCQYLER